MSNSYLPETGTTAALGAFELRDKIVGGDMTARAVADALLARIAEVEPHVQAFAWHDPDHVRAQADALDAWVRAGRRPGPLHGVPVGIKDIIDTRGIPTEYGCGATKGNVPVADATIVERLYAAGAIIMGKTVTTEAAFMQPGPTRNPLNTQFSPGGSSSGSAAAVAAGMVPLAIGTQTGGSVTRPASFCGIVGYKPSFGLIPRRGILEQSHTLDTVGVFARSTRDAALLVDALSGQDSADPATHGVLPTALYQEPPIARLDPLHLALVRLPHVAEEHYTRLRAALFDLPSQLVKITECDLPDGFDRIAAWREQINFVEMAQHYGWLEDRNSAALSDKIRAAMAAGRQVAATDYVTALTMIPTVQAQLRQHLGAFDAILSTATAGHAPRGLESTGTAICNGLWTYIGGPVVNLPIGRPQEDGLRFGVQIAGCKDRDAVIVSVAQTVAGLMRRLYPGNDITRPGQVATSSWSAAAL